MTTSLQERRADLNGRAPAPDPAQLADALAERLEAIAQELEVIRRQLGVARIELAAHQNELRRRHTPVESATGPWLRHRAAR